MNAYAQELRATAKAMSLNKGILAMDEQRHL